MQLEKIFIGKSKEILANIDPSIQLCDVLVSFGQFIRYNVVIRVTTPVSVGVSYYIGTTKYFCLYDAELCQDGSSRTYSLA